MTDLSELIAKLLRPKLLVRAARYGVRQYDRARHLPRALGGMPTRSAQAILHNLVELEDDLNSKRLAKDAAYSTERHVSVLTALLAEAGSLTLTAPNVVSFAPRG